MNEKHVEGWDDPQDANYSAVSEDADIRRKASVFSQKKSGLQKRDNLIHLVPA